MVVSEVALSCVLLIGAGLLLRSFLAVLNSDLGFQPSRAAVMKIDYNASTPAQRGIVLRDLLQRVQSIPGIQIAGVADMLPLGRNRSWAFQRRGQTYPPGIPGDIALVRIVTPGYLPAMSMRLVSGRDFNWHDSDTSTPVMIINQAAARRFFPGQDPLALTLRVMDGKGETHVVGVLSNVRENSLETQPEPEVYLPVTQADPEGAELVIRSSLPPASIAPSIMKALRSLNPATTGQRTSPAARNCRSLCFAAPLLRASSSRLRAPGLAAGLAWHLWRHLLFRHAANAGNWNSYGAWRNGGRGATQRDRARV